MKVVGFRRCEFTAKDKTEVKGYNIFVEEEISSNGKGLQTNKYFFSDAKIAKLNMDIEGMLDHNIILSYNRWGSVEHVIVQD